MHSENNSFEVPSYPIEDSKPKKKWYKKWWGIIIVIFIFLFLTVGSALAIYVGRVVIDLQSGKITPQELLGGDSVSQADLFRTTTMATTDDPSFGPRDAKVVIVEFSDFQCPFCAQVYPVIKEIKKKYEDKVHFVYRDFPVTSIHPQAVLGALAGECASEQGKFWEMHDLIFEDQAGLNEPNLKLYAIQLGLNGVQFSSCLDGQKYLEEVQQDLRDGIDAGVRATPTFFINGNRVEGALPLDIFEQIILTELNR